MDIEFGRFRIKRGKVEENLVLKTNGNCCWADFEYDNDVPHFLRCSPTIEPYYIGNGEVEKDARRLFGLRARAYIQAYRYEIIQAHIDCATS